MKRIYVYIASVAITTLVIFVIYQLESKQQENQKTVTVTGTNFTLNYTITGDNKIESISIDPLITYGLDILISANSNGNFTITLPRELIDNKINGSDVALGFIPFYEGEAGSGYAVEKKDTSTDRTITFYFESGEYSMRVVGSSVFHNSQTNSVLPKPNLTTNSEVNLNPNNKTITNLENYKTENLTLFVSNQSPVISTVDIAIHIDRKLVVQGNFNFSSSFDGVGTSGHTYLTYYLSLQNGTHKIDVESTGGNAKLEEMFQINGTKYAVLDYEYDPSHNSTQRHFSFSTLDEPPAFS